MIRLVTILLIAIVLITLLRSVLGLLMKAAVTATRRASSPAPSPDAVSGELKRDPVCGVFVSTATSVKSVADGEVVHFCSTACRDQYRG